MKTKNKIARVIIAVSQSQQLRPLLLTFVLFLPLFGVNGCGHKH